MKSKILFSTIFFFTLFFSNAQIKTIGVTAFAKEIKTTTKPQLLDVRTPEEFSGGHIDNAVNIDWQNENFIKNTEKLNKNKPVYVYCRSGKRSLKAPKNWKN